MSSVNTTANTSVMARGQIYRVNLEPTVGSEQQGTARPCVVLSVAQLNQRLRTIGVVPLSSSGKSLPPVVVSVPSAGPNSVAPCHQLRAVDKLRVGKYMGDLSADDLNAVERGVKTVYGLS
jgi:mRNA interferase MazF